jgi:hypothetical protein
LYSYVTSNPASNRDPSGLLSPRDLLPVTPGCLAAQQEVVGLLHMMANLEFTSREYGPGPDKIAHCLAHCIIRKGCGPLWGNFYSAAGGFGTEAVEHALGKVSKRTGYPPGWARHQWSSQDMAANEHGRACPADVDCPSRCALAGRTLGSN